MSNDINTLYSIFYRKGQSSKGQMKYYVHKYIQTFVLRLSIKIKVQRWKNNANTNTKQVSILDKGETSISFYLLFKA